MRKNLRSKRNCSHTWAALGMYEERKEVGISGMSAPPVLQKPPGVAGFWERKGSKGSNGVKPITGPASRVVQEFTEQEPIKSLRWRKDDDFRGARRRRYDGWWYGLQFGRSWWNHSWFEVVVGIGGIVLAGRWSIDFYAPSARWKAFLKVSNGVNICSVFNVFYVLLKSTIFTADFWKCIDKQDLLIFNMSYKFCLIRFCVKIS